MISSLSRGFLLHIGMSLPTQHANSWYQQVPSPLFHPLMALHALVQWCQPVGGPKSTAAGRHLFVSPPSKPLRTRRSGLGFLVMLHFSHKDVSEGNPQKSTLEFRVKYGKANIPGVLRVEGMLSSIIFLRFVQPFHLTVRDRCPTLALDPGDSSPVGQRQARCHGTAGETSDLAALEGHDASGVASTATDLDAQLKKA